VEGLRRSNLITLLCWQFGAGLPNQMWVDDVTYG
jgi:hypothetical protein